MASYCFYHSAETRKLVSICFIKYLRYSRVFVTSFMFLYSNKKWKWHQPCICTLREHEARPIRVCVGCVLFYYIRCYAWNTSASATLSCSSITSGDHVPFLTLFVASVFLVFEIERNQSQKQVEANVFFLYITIFSWCFDFPIDVFKCREVCEGREKALYGNQAQNYCCFRAIRSWQFP